MKQLLPILVFLASWSTIAQRDSTLDQGVADAYHDYFKTDRKSVHVHLNKTGFNGGERIWFSTYLFNQTLDFPSRNEEYVYIDLLTESGKRIDQRIILSRNGHGKGDIVLSPSLPSGLYFLQAYTANMQGFEEDDSSIYPIRVQQDFNLDPLDYAYQKRSPQPQIAIVAEGGQLVAGTMAKCMVRITDVQGQSLRPKSLEVRNAQGELILKPAVASRSLIPFNFIPKEGNAYVLIADLGDSILRQPLPEVSEYGVAISLHRNPKTEELIVQLTDRRARNERAPLRLYLHKDNKLLDFPFPENGASGNYRFKLAYDVLFQGMNALTVIDAEKKVWTERLFFQQKEKNTVMETALEGLNQDSIRIALSMRKGSLSLSVLPSGTQAQRFRKNAFFALQLEPYFKGAQWTHLWTAVAGIPGLDNRTDDLTLFAKAKYDWRNIFNDNLRIPNENYVTGGILGVVEPVSKKVVPESVLLYSKSNELFRNSSVSNGRFTFKDISFKEGSTLNFSLIGNDGKPHQAKFNYSIQPGIDKFRHRFSTEEVVQTASNPDSATPTSLNANVPNLQQLEGVTLSAKKLKYQKYFKTFFGVKVDSSIGMKTLREMLLKEGVAPLAVPVGFPDTRRAGSISLGKSSNRCGYVFPAVMIDGIYSAYTDPYENLAMEYIDEIYIDRPTSCSFLMVVFTNEAYKNRTENVRGSTSKALVMEKGFYEHVPFKRQHYITDGLAFEHFGILGWYWLDNHSQPITVPRDNQDGIRIIIEGFTESGTISSQDITLAIN